LKPVLKTKQTNTEAKLADLRLDFESSLKAM